MIITPTRILITGASGFVGHHLLEKCRVRYPDATIYGMYRRIPHTTQIVEDVHPVIADVMYLESMQRMIEQVEPDLVFHLAAQSSVADAWKDPMGTFHCNVEGGIHLLEALRCAHLAPRVVVVGSSEQYGLVSCEEMLIAEEYPFRPVHPYAVSKAALDLYAYHYFAAYQLPVLRVRPFTHFGPYQAPTFVIASLARQIALIEADKKKPVLLMGDLNAKRDFLPVEDVVEAYFAVAERGHAGEAYNVGSGTAHSIREIVQILLRYATVPVQLLVDPARVRPGDQGVALADTSRLAAHTGWIPSQDMLQALKRTLDYWRKIIS